MDKKRLDVHMVEAGLAPSREKARAMIMAGEVFVNGKKAEKAGEEVRQEDAVTLHEAPVLFVSRGGLKLDKALKVFPLSLQDKVCLDVGASTGGFTDCMLQNGAKHVTALDVGYGQLDWKLRNDDRVVVMEQTNFRYVTPEDIGEPLDFASVDVSFISLTKILIPARNLLKPGAQMVCLVKPQFEAGKDKVGKNGVVREVSTHREVICKIVDFADMVGFDVLHLTFSPIKGPEGNIEYLLHIRKKEELSDELLAETSQEAEDRLKEVIAEKTGLSQSEEWKAVIDEIVEKSHELA